MWDERETVVSPALLYLHRSSLGYPWLLHRVFCCVLPSLKLKPPQGETRVHPWDHTASWIMHLDAQEGTYDTFWKPNGDLIPAPHWFSAEIRDGR